jgi:ABC-2 type transport system permease protein
MGAYGLSLSIGSLALLLKRVQQLLSFLPFGLLFVLTVPIESWSGPARFLSLLLPMAPGAGLMRALMARGEAIAPIPMLVAIANGGIYLGLGLVLFRRAEHIAKARGKLAGY